MTHLLCMAESYFTGTVLKLATAFNRLPVSCWIDEDWFSAFLSLPTPTYCFFFLPSVFHVCSFSLFFPLIEKTLTSMLACKLTRVFYTFSPLWFQANIPHTHAPVSPQLPFIIWSLCPPLFFCHLCCAACLSLHPLSAFVPSFSSSFCLFCHYLSAILIFPSLSVPCCQCQRTVYWTRESAPPCPALSKRHHCILISAPSDLDPV